MRLRFSSPLSMAFFFILAASTASAANRVEVFRLEGKLRKATVHLPPRIRGVAPVLVVLHGGGMTARQTQATLGIDRPANRYGFVTVYPQGIDNHWNDGRGFSEVDDVGFLSAVLDRVEARYPVDQARVYFTGPSNGGLMSFRVACELSGRIAGVAPVIASMPKPLTLPSRCLAARPLDVLMIAGTADTFVPYYGGAVNVFGEERGEVIGAPQSFELWRARNACAEGTGEERAHPGFIEHRASCAEGSVTLLEVPGGGHRWYGAGRVKDPIATRVLGPDPGGVDTTGEIVRRLITSR